MTETALLQSALHADSGNTLFSLFHPRSIAFIGASERPNTPASRGLRNCLRHGFKGRLYPINPKYPQLFGVACYPALADLPEVPELVMIALSAEMTLNAVAECKAAGVKTVVVCSAGWEEQGPEGVERARRLQQIMDGAQMRMLGPNCLGAGNPAEGLCLGYNSSFESMAHVRKGRVGLVTQSGAMMGGLLLNGEDAGADIGLYAHVGNAMDIGMEELAQYMLEDLEIDVVALMIEGLRQPKRFVEVARHALAIGKPLVVFKAGASELGRQAVMSHTGALAGSDEIFTAVCREQGILRVLESEDLLSTAAALAQWKNKQRVGQGGLLVFTLSGGAASILADECADAGVPVPELSASTLQKLAAILPSYVKASNPLDVGGAVFSDPELPRHALAIALEDEAIDSVLWVGVGAPRDERSQLWLNQALDVIATSDKASTIIPVSGYVQEVGFERARAMGIPVARSLRASAQLNGFARKFNQPNGPQGVSGAGLPELPNIEGLIDEVQSKGLLKSLGIPVPESRVASSAAEVANCARALAGTVVVKGLARGIAHKSEHGLVALNLGTPEAAQAAAEKMQAQAPELEFLGFLVERMAARGVEVVLGIKRDPAFGPVLMFGLGGISVELFKDVAFGMCPLSREAARELIGLTKAAALLRGSRGQPKADEEALIDAMVRLSQFAAYHADRLAEMDVNPVIVLPQGQGVLALDAMIACDAAP
ncbi:acetate--CoA ligase family protein [Ottowia thiooxydans]|uniref:acetate--CoA ligase family protein n=1 Tax=Ottowia thiooxydans TaxID=219182 RepID=UPI00048D5ABC|nr:acetate--CoA ligase family protein [Ottowia thiooxydans]